MALAFFSSPIPLLIENKGAPPLPKRLPKAVIIIIIGKHSPTAPRAFVPTSGILAMYTLSTILYNRLKICATSIGIAAFKILLVIVPFSDCFTTRKGRLVTGRDVVLPLWKDY